MARAIQVLALLLALAWVVACGAKSGLRVDASDASVEAAPSDAAPEVADALETTPDVAFDVPPPVCDDSGPPSVYVVTQQSTLHRFDPPTATFTYVGTLNCGMLYAPFSMAVARNGIAFVLNQGGYLLQVDTQTAACVPTAFVPNQLGWQRFGMGFVFDPVGSKDRLFVTESNYAAPSQGLATLDLSTLSLDFVAPYTEDVGHAVELTGTGDGRLFAFGLPTALHPATLAELDETNGALLSKVAPGLGEPNSSFAFAWWAGAFYFFVAKDAGEATEVTRYDLATGALSLVAKLDQTVVGAGVSTCAPH